MATTEPTKRDPEGDAVRIREPPPFAAGNKAETLEDLYALYPIGEPDWFLRFTREAPKVHRGISIVGWLDDVTEPLRLSDVQTRWGGGMYTVAVVGPASKPNSEGKVGQRQYASIEIRIQGDPILAEDVMNRTPTIVQQEDQRVALERVKQQERAEIRTAEALARASTAPAHVVQAMSQQAQQTVQEVKQASDRTTEVLREQVNTYSRALVERENEIRTLRDDLLRVRSDMSESIRRAESELERRLREAHESAARALQEGHSKEIAAVREAATKEVAALREQHYKESHEAEIRHQAALNDASRRYTEDMARRDSAENAMRNTFKEASDARLADLRASLEREISSVKADRDREVASLRGQYENSSQFTKETANVRLTSLNDELVRVRAENEKLRDEVGKLQRASIKDPVQFILETKQIASEVLGMVSADEAAAAAGPEKEEFDVKKEAIKAAFQFASKLPETVRGAVEQVSAMRAQNQQNIAAAEQMRATGQGAPGARQMGPGGPPRRRMAPPPQVWGGDGTPPPYVGPVVGAEIPFVQPYAPLHQPQVPPAQPPQPQAPQSPSVMPQAMPQAMPQQMVQMPIMQTQPQPQQFQPPQPPQPQSQQFQPQPQQQGQPGQDPQDGIVRFIAELDNAISLEMPAEMFAKAVFEQVGPEQIAQLLRDIPVQDFLNRLDQIGHDGACTATLDGREYTKRVWAKAAELVAGSSKG